MRRRRVAALPIVAAALFACACTTDPSSTAEHEPTPAISTGDLEQVHVRVQRIATLDQPDALAVRPGDPALYVAEKTGRVVRVGGGHGRGSAVLDLSNEVSLGAEQGLLGLAFSPDGGWLYVNLTDVHGDTRIDAFTMDGDVADPASRREIMAVDQPYANHNGGDLLFGPDGDLYIGLGDGGSGGDPHGNGQSLSTLLGKMLRIRPTPEASRPYAIPPDNPFIGRPGARPEIWAYGLRNPWRSSFDRATGDLWIGDVGQSSWEEVDLQPAASRGGEDYGWNLLEGSHPYAARTAPGTVPPVYEYPHTDGACVVTGGYVYRGTAIPGLAGAYVFADFCTGELQALRVRGDRVVAHARLGVAVPAVSSFGEDASGELYVLSLEGGVYRLVVA